MIALAQHQRPGFWLRMLAAGILLSSLVSAGLGQTQSGQRDAGLVESLHGTVLNRATHQPVAHALVRSNNHLYATRTNDRGQFEFKFPARGPEPAESHPQVVFDSADSNFARSVESGANAADPNLTRWIDFGPNAVQWSFTGRPDTHPYAYVASKPGFLWNDGDPSNGFVRPDQTELNLYLDPEALITGHVTIPGMEGDLQVGLELYHRDVVEGQVRWLQVGFAMTWADGEFRFAELKAGDYKLVARENLDRDPLTSTPGGQLFGYPPVYYPGAPDFSTAVPIHIAAGETFEANITPVRRAYHRVRIPVENPAAGQGMMVNLYPMGHPGPGYALGYDLANESITGTLPDGNYTVEANARGETGSTGILNFSVRGAAVEGPRLTLVPNASIPVRVREELKPGQSIFTEALPPVEASTGGMRARQVNLQVILTPVGEFEGEAAVSRPSEGSGEDVLVIPNIRPGRYRVAVSSAVGYAASVVSGSTDLLHQPLTIGLGGAGSPLEITLRDDGGEVDGTVEDPGADRRPEHNGRFQNPRYIYFLPTSGSSGQFRQAMSGNDGSFASPQLPPGTYRVLAFDRPQPELAVAREEDLQKLDFRSRLLDLEPGEQKNLRLTTIREGDFP